MSHVNNAMLFFSVGENEQDRMNEVNAYIDERDSRHQSFIDGSAESWYGGTKFLEAPLWGAAFNHVYEDVIMDAIRSAKWKHPEDVILMWSEQNDAAWQPIYPMKDDD